MKLRQILLGLGALGAASLSAAHFDRPEEAGGIYRAYPAEADSMPAAPAGYKPVYISHYGRHGSRWVIKDSIYPDAVNELRKQKTIGNLTPLGDSVITALERCGAHAQGHFGELSSLGQRQHRGIAARMASRFPSLFSGDVPVTACSSTSPRCIVSMGAFTGELLRRNPSLRLTTRATPGEMETLALDVKKGKGLPETISDREAARRMMREYYRLRDSLTRSEASARRLVKEPSKVRNLPKLMRDIYDAAIDVQDVDGLEDVNLLGVFTPDDLYDQWQSFNYRMYMHNVNSIVNSGSGPMSAVPLLERLLDDADRTLASGEESVDLRFGHDTVLIRLLALMGAEGCTGTDTSLSGANGAWKSQDVSPMGANLQLIFMRDGKGNVIMAPRLNEQPLRLEGVEYVKGAPGYYNWQEVRRLWRSAVHPAAALMERVCPGSSSRFIFEQTDTPEDFFELSAASGKPLIRGNNAVNVAAGLNWYLKYYPHIHLTWGNMTAQLPAELPLPAKTERRTTDLSRRYYLNYCTHSYSMAFWDRDRWQREIDWMALHGINMPLAITGTDVVWRNTLLRLGYTPGEADAFVAGPAFQAWWLMNNLEGWGGPNSPRWYEERAALQRDILASMRRWGMEPVLPGYSGMVPHDADERLGMEVSGKGLWNGFVRPAFLKTSDPKFDLIADIYYDELTRLCGPAKYYSMDPFHEGGSTEGVDLAEAGSIITRAMKRANPEAVWVIQGWNENPREELLRGIGKGDVVVLDLASEIKPNWGDPDSPSLTKRADGYGEHDWMFCMLLNFGGNVGLHGRMDNVIGGFYKARASKYDQTLTGVGLTPEGVENNPMMYELFSELMWRPERFSKEEWLRGYTRARYGADNADVNKAWRQLASTIYNCPWGNMQQGTTESVFCARPSTDVWQVSSWSRMAPYYRPEDVIAAAKRFAKGAEALAGNPNYVYDLVDITRQAISEKGRLTYRQMTDALKRGDAKAFDRASARFLSLIDAQDRLLATHPAFSVQPWLESARALGHDAAGRDLMESNARHLITTWGPREASEEGGLRDYAHREWHGLLGDLYRARWEAWINAQKTALATGKPAPDIDFYSIDERWVKSRDDYTLRPASEAVPTALAVIKEL